MELTFIGNIIITILFVAILGSINTLLSYLLDFCFWEHSIFGRWLPWVASWNLKFFDRKKYDELQLTKNSEGQDNRLIDAAQNLPYYKVLGGCVICMNIWLGIFTYFGIHVGFGLSFWYMFPYILFSSFLLRKIMKVG